MKIRLLIYLAIASGMMLVGCEKDNYDPPSSNLSGQLVYNGEPIGVRNAEIDNDIQIELWQKGYDLFTRIPVFMAQDGSYSAALFDGDYKLVLRDGPWVSLGDSIDVQVRGNTVQDIEINPYYTIEAVEYNRAGDVIRGVFNIDEVAGGREIENVRLYFNNSVIVDSQNQQASDQVSGASLGDLSEPVTLDINISETPLAGRDYIFARGGIKIAGVTEMIYTPVVKVLLSEDAAATE